MSEVRVRAVQFVAGIPVGRVVTIDRNRRVDALIEQGRLEVVPSDAEVYVSVATGDPAPPPALETVKALHLDAAPARSASRDEWAEHANRLADEAELAQDDARRAGPDLNRSQLLEWYDAIGV